MSKPTVTKTTNRLPFTELDPLRFEDLCLNLVYRYEDWADISHFGRKGSDNGIDIQAIQRKDGVEVVWYIQCKRYSNISKTNITDIIDKVTAGLTLPDTLLIIVACDISKTHEEYGKIYSQQKGINKALFWTASTLEAKLYKDYKDLLFAYFGLKISEKTKDNASKVKYSLSMERKIKKEFINHKFLKENRDYKTLIYKPYLKFISQEIIIRSVDDTHYPFSVHASPMRISPWFKTYFYDTYHNGIELWLSAVVGSSVIMDDEGRWELINHFDERKNSSHYRVIPVLEIGRIPYYNIVDYKIHGDEYFGEPHIFCRFDIDGMPYEEIYYRYDTHEKAYASELDKEMQTIFPRNQ